MLKAIVSYSKKIPVPGSEYSSQGYSLSLETEITETDPSAIRNRLHETFETVKASVEEELSGSKAGTGRQEPGDRQARPREPERKASNRQVKFITDLAAERGFQLQDLNADVRRRFNADGLYDLSAKQASTLIDEMSAPQQRRRAA